MKLKEFLSNVSLDNLKLNTSFLEREFTIEEADKNAAWEMYIELITRISTQTLNDDDGIENIALNSVYGLFGVTRHIIKTNGKECINFTKIAVIILNQILRPFTAKWHRSSEQQDAFKKEECCSNFRTELQVLQEDLTKCAKMLSNMIGVEDLSEIDRK